GSQRPVEGGDRLTVVGREHVVDVGRCLHGAQLVATEHRRDGGSGQRVLEVGHRGPGGGGVGVALVGEQLTGQALVVLDERVPLLGELAELTTHPANLATATHGGEGDDLVAAAAHLRGDRVAREPHDEGGDADRTERDEAI